MCTLFNSSAPACVQTPEFSFRDNNKALLFLTPVSPVVLTQLLESDLHSLDPHTQLFKFQWQGQILPSLSEEAGVAQVHGN